MTAGIGVHNTAHDEAKISRASRVANMNKKQETVCTHSNHNELLDSSRDREGSNAWREQKTMSRVDRITLWKS